MGKEKFRQVNAFFGILLKKITFKDFIIINFQDTILVKINNDTILIL